MSAIMYGTGNAHFDEWVDSLATTTLPQAQSRLVTINWETGNVEGYCCMGQACTLVPGLSVVVNEDVDEAGDPYPGDETRYDEVGYIAGWAEMAPPELLTHLLVEHDLEQSDIYVDLPEVYWPSQGAKGSHYDAATDTRTAIALNADEREPRLGCSTLNDRYNLTFAQISDVLRYFGIKDTVLLD